ncbi:uncharacterized protein FIBRA_03842 [Fibroporia radiculosa]|uniref:Uncharacterized protein n=1 Tax=Fibroporia radiculosa TaxID=599839 RepID=J4GNQ0_9APHY|nr:uncharacterized protein FIBRA_03842 [Fibroporia radiculosa]CCM01775.1 predicted protein [Fibroporia radiculosa]
MPRKAAPSSDASTEPRRSTRIKEQPKPESIVKKVPAKPRGKKAKTAEEAEVLQDVEDKPKSTRGKKRTASDVEAEEGVVANGNTAEEPPAKRVKPASKIASKPTSKVTSKPPSKAAGTSSKPASKVAGTSSKPTSKMAGTSSKPASKISRAGSVKPASRTSAKPPSTTGAKKPASRASSRKPVSKIGNDDKENIAGPSAVQETIPEESEAEETAEDEAAPPQVEAAA